MNLDKIRTDVLELFYKRYMQNPTLWVAEGVIVKTIVAHKNHILATIEFLEDEKYLKVKK